MDEINLYDLNDRLLDDCAFSSAALDKLHRIQSRLPECLHSTYTVASSASALVNHWLVERKLDCYVRGRKVDDVTAISLSASDQDFGRAADIYDAFAIIRCDELVSLMKKEGLPIPLFLADEDEQPDNIEPEPAHHMGEAAEMPRHGVESKPDIGVSRDEIAAVFPPLNGQTPEQWKNMLRDARAKWLRPARLDAGRSGIQSRWNPAQLAICLEEKGAMQRCHLGVIIRRHFPEYLPEWEVYAGSFEN